MEWIKEQQEQNKRENEARLKELGYDPIVPIVNGANELVLDVSKPPKAIDTDYGVRFSFPVEGEKIILVSKYLRDLIIDRLAQGGKVVDNGKVKITITRVGEGKQTRYEVD